MKIEDPLQLLTPHKVGAICRGLRLPLPTAIRAAGPPGVSQLYGMKFGGDHPPEILRVDLVPNARGPSVDHAIAANQVFGMQDDFPAPRNVRRIPTSVLGVPAAVYAYRDWTPGIRLVSLKPDFAGEVGRQLGRLLGVLEDTLVPSFGLRAGDRRFVPSRGTWREEWESFVHGLGVGGRAMALDLGPLTDAALDAIDSRIAALDDVVGFSLVHGELRPSALLYALDEGEPRLAEVSGFDHALQGDPLVELGTLLSMPDGALGPILESYGADRAQSWLDPSAIARIEVYRLTQGLVRLNRIAQLLLRRREVAALDAVEGVRHHLAQILEADATESRIRAALDEVGNPRPIGESPPPLSGRTTLRRALLLFRGDEAIPTSLASSMIIALGAACLGADLDDQPVFAHHVEATARQVIDSIPRLGVSLGTQPIPDRTQWRTRLVEDVLSSAASTGTPSGTRSLMLLWLGLSAIDRLDGTVSDGVLRGLEGLVRAVALADQRDPRANDLERRQHALLGRAALTWLGEQGLAGPHGDGLAHALEEQLRDLVELGVPGAPFAMTDRFEDEEILPMVAAATGSAEARLTRPTVVLALRTLNGRVTLPGSATDLLGPLGG